MIKFVSNENNHKTKLLITLNKGALIMRLVRYNPFNDMRVFKNSFNDFFNDSLFDSNYTKKQFLPAVDIASNDDDVILKVDLPGMKKEDISVNLEDNVLTIKGERKIESEENKDNYYRRERSFGSFERTFSLSDELLTEEVEAKFVDGVLEITLKKDKTKAEVKQITIN